jgi:phage major head subunit gpT-like protein
MGTLNQLGFRHIEGKYFFAHEEREKASWASAIASVLTTDQPQEIIKWIGASPVMTKWTGERLRQQLTDFGITLVPDKFTATVEVDIDDYRRDKTGQTVKRVQEMAVKSATLPQRVLTPLLEGNGTGYDGATFFSTTHSVGNSGTHSNDITVSGLGTPDDPTSAGMVSSILKGIQQLYSFNDDRGDPINGEAMSFAVMVPVKYWAATAAAMKNEYTSAGVSNTLVNAGVSISPYVNPRLTGTAAAAGRRIYVFRTDASIRSLIWLDESIDDAFKTLDPSSENGFWRDSIAFGSKRIGQGGLGRWELACRVNLAA